MTLLMRTSGGGWRRLGVTTNIVNNIRGCVVAASVREDVSLEDALPPEQIPGPRILPVVGTAYKYLPGGGFDMQRLGGSRFQMYRQYGPVVREKLGTENMVHLYDVRDVEKLLRIEGNRPKRPLMRLFTKLAEDMDVPEGLASVSGEQWHHQRSAVNKDMMRPQTVAQYIPAQGQVADDLARVLREKRDPDGEVKDVLQYLNCYSLEAIGLVCYDRRLGVFDITEQNKEEHVGQYVMDNSKTLMNSVMPLMMKSSFIEKGFFKKEYQRFLTASQNLHKITQKLMSAEKTSGAESKKSILARLLQNERVSPKEATNMMTGLLAGGVDSTAYTLSHVLYHLARNPDVQEKLHEELVREIPAGQPVTHEILSTNLKYLRAVVREINRISPAAPSGVVRTLDHDAVFGGYRVPAGWSVLVQSAVMSLLPEHFDAPEEFRPERWLSDNRDLHKKSAFIILPFGHGARSCLGRRFAEQELYLAVIKLVQNFRFEYHHDDLGLIIKTFQELDGPLNLKLVDRE